MPKKIDNPHWYGISFNHETMDNGELRFRMMGADGSGYIRCCNPGPPAWENSHSHTSIREMILVQSGSVVFAELKGHQVVFTLLNSGEFVVTHPNSPHNACIGQDAEVHTVKFGDCRISDWIPCPELDMATKPVSFQDAVQISVGNKKS